MGVMLVDVDHNDLDDRFAIILLAYQMASASLEQRNAGEAEGNDCRLLLDGRTYQTQSGVVVWRVLRLAARLNRILGPCGLCVEPVFSSRDGVIKLCSAYLEVDATASALDAVVPGVGQFLGLEAGSAPTNARLRTTFAELPAGTSSLSVWVLSGLCDVQIDDISALAKLPELTLNVIEQAQAAWQSVDVDPAEVVQPAWDVLSGEPLDDRGYGAEPSNLRSSEESYPKTLHSYMRFQHALADSAAAALNYIIPALARTDGALPAPPGKQMLRVSGRTFLGLPGPEFVTMAALDKERSDRIFNTLLSSAKTLLPETLLYEELCTSTADDLGRERPDVKHISKHGTFMADAIVIALAARPTKAQRTSPVSRRLAVVKADPSGPCDWP